MMRCICTAFVIASAVPAHAEWSVEATSSASGVKDVSIHALDTDKNSLLAVSCSDIPDKFLIVTFTTLGPKGWRGVTSMSVNAAPKPDLSIPLSQTAAEEDSNSLSTVLRSSQESYRELLSVLANSRVSLSIGIGENTYQFDTRNLKQSLDRLRRECGLRSLNPAEDDRGKASRTGPVSANLRATEQAGSERTPTKMPTGYRALDERSEPEGNRGPGEQLRAPPVPPSGPERLVSTERPVPPRIIRDPGQAEVPSGKDQTGRDSPESNSGRPLALPFAAAASASSARSDPVKAPSQEPPAAALEAASASSKGLKQRSAGGGIAVQAVMARAREQIRLGNIAAARLLLEHIEPHSNRDALLALAQTFDPQILAQWRVFGVKPDAARAAELYRRAAAQQDPDGGEVVADRWSVTR